MFFCKHIYCSKQKNRKNFASKQALSNHETSCVRKHMICWKDYGNQGKCRLCTKHKNILVEEESCSLERHQNAEILGKKQWRCDHTCGTKPCTDIFYSKSSFYRHRSDLKLHKDHQTSIGCSCLDKVRHHLYNVAMS